MVLATSWLTSRSFIRVPERPGIYPYNQIRQRRPATVPVWVLRVPCRSSEEQQDRKIWFMASSFCHLNANGGVCASSRGCKQETRLGDRTWLTN